MELQQYARIARRYWRSLVATLLLCVAVAAALTLTQKPTYTASSVLFLAVESGDTAGELSQGATYAERQVTSYVNVATTAVVLQPVIEQLGLESTPKLLAEQVTVSSPTSTSIIQVSAADGDPTQAALIANRVAESLALAVDDLSPAGEKGARLVTATVVDPALAPTAPTAPRPVRNLALGVVVGLMLGIGQAVLRSVLDTRLRTAADLDELTDAPLLGTIGHGDDTGRTTKSDGRNVAVSEAEEGHWANAEAYRRLRTNVGFVGLGGERRPSMVITSSMPSEGKTQTVTNLARVLAQAGESVLLIDADLRRPQVANRLSLDSEFGLSDVLTGREVLEEMIIEVSPAGLSVLPAGTVPPNPSELLGSEAMSHLLATVERQFDHILFDAPPLLPVTDAVVLAGQTGGAIMVARSGKVRRPEFESAAGLLKAGSVDLLGVVLNDVPSVGGGYGSKYGNYSSATAVSRPKETLTPVEADPLPQEDEQPELEGATRAPSLERQA